MKTSNTIFTILCIVALVFPSCGGDDTAHAPQTGTTFVELVAAGDSDIFSIPFDRYRENLTGYPIGVFDSGIGGLTVLEAILTVDRYDNATHEEGADGIPDFRDERFVYLGDQANMPYGNYPAEDKTGFLRENILKDAAFLLGTRYYPDGGALMPRHDKPPVKAIVIACNTATAYGLEDVRVALETWNVPVYLVGVVEAGAKGAVEALAESGGDGSVAVMATVGTCASEGYVRAVEGLAEERGMAVPPVIQQGCLGLAGSVEGDVSYIVPGTDNPDYRGPAMDNPAAPIDPERADRYAFDTEGLLGDPGDPSSWKLNSVENYIRYHTAVLADNIVTSDAGKPVRTVILGCTHFPFYADRIEASFDRLREFTTDDGIQPYVDRLADDLTFIDPAVLTADDLYAALFERNLLTGPSARLIDIDEFYISVPNRNAPGVELAETGGFTYDYKYGRTAGRFDIEYVKRVPMSAGNLSDDVRTSIRDTMPAVWERLVSFVAESPRTEDLPESARIR